MRFLQNGVLRIDNSINTRSSTQQEFLRICEGYFYQVCFSLCMFKVRSLTVFLWGFCLLEISNQVTHIPLSLSKLCSCQQTMNSIFSLLELFSAYKTDQWSHLVTIFGCLVASKSCMTLIFVCVCFFFPRNSLVKFIVKSNKANKKTGRTPFWNTLLIKLLIT